MFNNCCYVIKYNKGFVAAQCTRVTGLESCDRFSSQSEALNHLYFYVKNDDAWQYEVVQISESAYG